MLHYCLSACRVNHGRVNGMNCSLTSRQKPKLKPSIKAKGKTAQYWSKFSFFFIVEGNYSCVVGSSILVESWWSMELAFSERRPRKLEEEQELGRGCRKAQRQVFLHTHRRLKVNMFMQAYNLHLSPCPKQSLHSKANLPLKSNFSLCHV